MFDILKEAASIVEHYVTSAETPKPRMERCVSEKSMNAKKAEPTTRASDILQVEQFGQLTG